MSHEVERLSETKRKIKVKIEAEDLEREYSRILKVFARRGKIPGFRPGKAPLEIVERVFRKEIEDALLDELFLPRVEKAIDEAGAKPVRPAVLKKWDFERGKDVELEAEFEELPEFEAKDYKGIKVTEKKVEVREEDVQAALEQLRKKLAKYVPVEREIKEGDYVGVRVSAMDKETKRRLPQMKFAVIASEKGEEVEKMVIGKKKGETFSYERSYPEDYPDKRMAGKTFLHEVEIIEAMEVSLPEFNDEFAKNFNYKTLEELKERLKEDLEKEFKEREKSRLNREILDKVLEKNDIPVPEILVEEEYRELVKEQMQEWARSGLYPTKEKWKEISQQLRELAQKNVKTMILLDKIASQENIEVKDEEVDEEVKAIAQRERVEFHRLKDYFKRENVYESLRRQIRRNKVLDFIHSQAIIESEEEEKKS